MVECLDVVGEFCGVFGGGHVAERHFVTCDAFAVCFDVVRERCGFFKGLGEAVLDVSGEVGGAIVCECDGASVCGAAWFFGEGAGRVSAEDGLDACGKDDFFESAIGCEPVWWESGEDMECELFVATFVWVCPDATEEFVVVWGYSKVCVSGGIVFEGPVEVFVWGAGLEDGCNEVVCVDDFLLFSGW